MNRKITASILTFILGLIWVWIYRSVDEIAQAVFLFGAIATTLISKR